ncbi:DUF4870 domain-containing protein [bacterium]|nr:DUF4870 domain-containing protein [bacterium]
MNTTPENTVIPGAPDEQSRLFAAVGYLPPLFFVPLYLGKKDEYSVWHGKQGLIVTILSVIGGILSSIVAMLIPIIGGLVVMAYNLFVFVLIVGGAWHAYKGEKWELPLVGKFAKEIKL